MSEKISVMISEDELEAKIAEMGKKISEDYAGEEVYIICILRALLSLHVSWPRELQFQL
jgi:hypoxanthine phosphoribosyltransferase